MKISIVIPVYREVNIKYTELCVDSLRRNSKERHEIILVINPGIDVSVYQHIDADIIMGIEEQGQCQANNVGIEKASNEWICVADNDNVFPPNWEKGLEHLKPDMVLTFNSMEKVTGIPKVVTYDCGDIDNFDIEKFEKNALEMKEENFISGFSYPFIVEKKHLQIVEGFDENFDPYSSTCDTDLRYKFMLLGLDLQRYLGVICYHFAQITSVNGGDVEAKGMLRTKNYKYFESKWNLAQAPNPQIWTSEFKINEDRRRFQPEWAGQVSKRWFGTEEDNQYWQCQNCRQMNFLYREKCFQCNNEKSTE